MDEDVQILAEAYYYQVLKEEQQVNIGTLVNAVQELQNSIQSYLDILPKDSNTTHPILAHDLQIIKQLQEGILDLTSKYNQQS